MCILQSIKLLFVVLAAANACCDLNSARKDIVWAAWYCDAEAVDFLLSKGASMSSTSTKKFVTTNDWCTGCTALHVAAATGNIGVVSLLLAKGANINAESTDFPGFTPLYWAINERQNAVSLLLLQSGANPNIQDKTTGQVPLHLTANNRPEGASQLLLYGADTTFRDRYNMTPAESARYKGFSVVGAMIDNYVPHLLNQPLIG